MKISEILEDESKKERQDDKFNKVDILVKNEDGHLVLIEVQNRTPVKCKQPESSLFTLSHLRERNQAVMQPVYFSPLQRRLQQLTCF